MLWFKLGQVIKIISYSLNAFDFVRMPNQIRTKAKYMGRVKEINVVRLRMASARDTLQNRIMKSRVGMTGMPSTIASFINPLRIFMILHLLSAIC